MPSNIRIFFLSFQRRDEATLLERKKHIAFTTRMAGTRKLQLTLRLTVVAVSNLLSLARCLNNISCFLFWNSSYYVIVLHQSRDWNTYRKMHYEDQLSVPDKVLLFFFTRGHYST